MDFITKNYSTQKVEINKEIDKIENFLIESKYLKSKSGNSYFEFYQNMTLDNYTQPKYNAEIFENILKLTPDKLYSKDCLQELKKIDPKIIKNSKYFEMSKAIIDASEKEISPSNLAKAITNVLTPTDFDKPYYRIISLILITSLSSYTIEEKDKNPIEKYVEDNSIVIMEVSINSNNQIIVNEEIKSQDELKSNLKDFIKKNKANHIIKFETDNKTLYKLYVSVLEDFNAIYEVLQNELANEKFKMNFNQLNEKEQQEIKEIYPYRIKEKIDKK